MSKKVNIKEEDIEPECEPENREEIVEQVNNTSPPAPLKDEPRTRITQLHKCDYCDKYMTRKSLNYSHARWCKGRPENQVKKESPKESEPIEPQPSIYQQEPPYQPAPHYEPSYVIPQLPTYEQMRTERRRQHLAKINHLSQFIA